MRRSKWFLFLVSFASLFPLISCRQLPGESVPTLIASTLTPFLTNTPYPTITSLSPTASPTATLSASLASVRIAFTYEGKLWLWQNGIASPLTSINDNASVNISDDGKIIAFTRDGLWVINSDGSNERLLLGDEDFRQMEPKDPGVALHDFDWVPNTHMLLFNTILSDDRGLSPTDDLYIVDAETLQWKMLRKPAEGGKFFVSPDGQRVAMTTPTQIRLMNMDGSHYHVVMDYSVPFPSDYAYYAVPTWSPDSQFLTVPIPPEDFYYTVTTSPTVVWRLPVDGTPPTIISQLPAGESGYDTRIWSTNRQHFAIWLDETASYHLDTDGTVLNPLTEAGSSRHQFAWVDETHFIYYLNRCDLRVGTIGASSISIRDASTDDIGCSSKFDFAK